MPPDPDESADGEGGLTGKTYSSTKPIASLVPVTIDEIAAWREGGNGEHSGLVQTSRQSSGQAFDSFDEFFRADFRQVVGLMHALSGSWLAAEDLAQDAFIAASKHWEAIRNYDKPRAWVRKVALRGLRSWGRRRRAEGNAILRFISAQDFTGVARLPTEAAEIWQEVRKLPPRQAEVIALFYYEGYSVAEITEILDIAGGTVKAHLNHARKRLARTLDRRSEGEGHDEH
jgi:RNA polymerase sigma factor (sigma-70 family)